MSELTQVQADTLRVLPKRAKTRDPYQLPHGGGMVDIPLESFDGREEFRMIVRQSRIDLRQRTFQNMVRQTIILVRLDIEGPPHTNPDGHTMPCPHIHLYREGYADKWASPVDPLVFTNQGNLWHTLMEFFDFCNVTEIPIIAPGLFH